MISNNKPRALVWFSAMGIALFALFTLATQALGDSTADLSIAQVAKDSAGNLVDSTHRIYAGQVLGYTVTVTNAGPSDALGVSLTETAPAELDPATLQSCDPQATDCSITTNFTDYVSGTAFALGDIAVGTSKDLQFRGTVAAGTVPNAVEITNSASATSTVIDPNTANNTDVALSTPVNTKADLSISQVAKNAAGKTFNATREVHAGQVITYVATVSNDGPSYAQNVKVSDQVDSALTGSQSCTAASCTVASSFQAYTSPHLISLGTIKSGAKRTVSFRASAPSSLSSTVTSLTNVAAVKSYKTATGGATSDFDAADRTSTLTIPVASAPTTSSTNSTPLSLISANARNGVYFGPLGPATYFQPEQPRSATKTVTYQKVTYYTSMYGKQAPESVSAPVVDTAVRAVPVATTLIRAPEEVWLLLPVGVLLIVLITYLVLEPNEDEQPLLDPGRIEI
jgi:uncharacterized repeat protein (TIGR01451 family)